MLRIITTFCSFTVLLLPQCGYYLKTSEGQSKQVAGEDSTAYTVDNLKDTYFTVGFAGLANLGLK